MRNRKFRSLILLAMGCSFQITGCQSDQVAVFLAETIKDAALGVGSIVIGSAMDNALGLDELN